MVDGRDLSLVVDPRHHVRLTVLQMLNVIEERELPLPLDFTFSGKPGNVEVNWMLQDDLSGSRAVVNAFPGTWSEHISSKASEPIFEHQGEGFEVTLWAHPETIDRGFTVP